MNKTYIDKNGYRRFSDSHKLVHRWVAEKKGSKPLGYGFQVHHKDGKKLNNNPENLEWVTRRKHIEKHPYIKKNMKIERQESIRKTESFR